MDTPYFDVRVIDLTKPMHRDMMKYDSFVISMCMEGDCKIHVRSTGDEIVLKEGNSTLIPAAIADYDIIPLFGTVRILDAYIDNWDKNIVHRAKRFIHSTRNRIIVRYEK